MDDTGTITSRELAVSLGTSPQKVSWWIRKGMPTRSRNGVYRMDPGEVESWLTEKGIIQAEHKQNETSDRVVATRADVAKHFGVNEHTISAWQRRDGFPGRSGSPGRRDGHYPLDEIEEWRNRTILKNDPAQRESTNGTLGDDVKSGRARLLRIQCDERELRLAEKRGELISVAAVTSSVERLVNQSAAIVDELPDRVLSCMPSDTTESARRAIRDTVSRVAVDVMVILGELLVDDEDNAEE